MGRHSSRPRPDARADARRERLILNSLKVFIVTCVATLVVYVGIATHAVAKNNEVPMPTVYAEAAQPTAGQRVVTALTGREPIPEPTMLPADSSAMRYCPATGCGATTCHAETGEPIPGR